MIYKGCTFYDFDMNEIQPTETWKYCCGENKKLQTIELILYEIKHNELNSKQVNFLYDNYEIINKNKNDIIQGIIKQFNDSSYKEKKELIRILDYYRKYNRMW